MQSTDLPEILNGDYLTFSQNLPILFLSNDSRNIIDNRQSLFFAISGKIHNGHDYIEDLYNRNVRQFLIEDKNFRVHDYPEGNFYYFPDSIKALQNIASFHRSKFSLKTIGITGSNGKTIVKEWLSQLLSWKFQVIKSPKSYNSQIGVPLSVWLINSTHEYGVFEAGISTTGEMQNLQKIIKPDVGILTNIGPAHNEGFETKEEKLREKLNLFSNSSELIFNIDDELISRTIDNYLPGIRKISWGKDPKAEYQINTITSKDSKTTLEIKSKENVYSFRLNFSDYASLENIVHCIVTLLHFKWSHGDIQEGIDEILPVSMRLEIKKGINDSYIIDDSYNNDLAGLEIALSYLNNQKQRKQKSIIVSDILQSGLPKEQLYRKTAQLINQYHFKKIVGIGEEICKAEKLFNDTFYGFKDTDGFLSEYEIDEYNDEIVLIKGARPFGLERIVEILQEKVHGTVLEINLDAINHNLNVYRSFLNPGTKIMVMVKALAYGSGSIEVANLLEFHRVDYLGVAYIDEGVTLRKNGISLPIMIMNPSIDSFEKIVRFRLEPEIYNFRLLNELSNYTHTHKVKVKVHIKLDTGMHRLGFIGEDIAEMIAVIKANQYIEVASVFSHLAGADDEDLDFYTTDQVHLYKEQANQIEKAITAKFIRHVANSAAIIRNPEYHFDMVRLGIGLYGFDASGIINQQLRPIGILKTEISQILNLKKGESVGYGRKGVLSRDSNIATVAIGYADGFSRLFSNGNASMLVNGRLAPVIGNVCMDMTMIDITGIDANEGSEVIVFGNTLSLITLSKAINTIPYEILTNISDRVKRIYISE